MAKDPNAPPPGDIPVGKLVGGPGAKPPAKPAAKAVEPAKNIKKPVPAPVAAVPPAAAAAEPVGHYDVELVAIPFPPSKLKLPGDQRPLYDMDRRDFLMLGGGVAGAVLAILAAMGLAKAVRRKPPDEK